MSIVWFSREELIAQIPTRIIPVNSVLDIGPGIYPQSFFTPSIHILVEPFLPYLQQFQSVHKDYAKYFYLNTTWEKIFPHVLDKTVDSIFALNVIEHFEKEEGVKFIAEAERIARKQIIIYTPLGWYPQSYQDDESDRWGMKGGYWQSHRSAWEPSDFPDGWDHYGCKAYHFMDHHEQPLEEPIGVFWAIRTFDTVIEKDNPLALLSNMKALEILQYLTRRIARKIKSKLKNNG